MIVCISVSLRIPTLLMTLLPQSSLKVKKFKMSCWYLFLFKIVIIVNTDQKKKTCFLFFYYVIKEYTAFPSRPIGGFPNGSAVKNSSVLQETQETWLQSLGWEDLLEERMATHSSILAWRIPWTEETSGLQSIESQSVRHNWVTKHNTIVWEKFWNDRMKLCCKWIIEIKAKYLRGHMKSFQ